MSKRFSNARAVALGALALLVAGCGLDGVDGNGQRVNEVRALAGFSSVDSEGSLDVQITRADAFHVEVSIDSNLLGAVRTQVVGDVLSIDVVEPIGDTVAGPHVIVTMPVLHGASLGGSGGVSAQGFQQADPVSLALDGSGQLSFAGEVPRAQVRASGSGDTQLQGVADELSVALDGSGGVDARSLDATTADLTLDGSGDLAARVSGSVRVALSGSGNIDLYGAAALDSVTVSGSGSLRRH